MSIGDLIKEIRISKKLSRRELSNLSGVSESAIKQYETSKRQPQIEQLRLLANALSIPVSFFLSLEEIESSEVADNSILSDGVDMRRDYFSIKTSSKAYYIRKEYVLDFLDRYLNWPVPKENNADAKMLFNYERLNEQGKQKARDYINDLAQQDKYIKSED